MNKPQIEMWDIARVKPYKNNAKIHDEKQVEKIAKSIKEFGWRGNPIVVDREGVIIAGHGRRLHQRRRRPLPAGHARLARARRRPRSR